MNMLKVVLLVVVVLWGVSSARNVSAESEARPATSPAAKQGVALPGRDLVSIRIESLTRHVGLTPEQREAIKPIYVEEADGLKELRANGKLTADEKKGRSQEIISSAHTRIRAILTAEQQQKYDQLLKDMAARRKTGARK